MNLIEGQYYTIIVDCIHTTFLLLEDKDTDVLLGKTSNYFLSQVDRILNLDLSIVNFEDLEINKEYFLHFNSYKKQKFLFTGININYISGVFYTEMKRKDFINSINYYICLKQIIK